MLFGYALNFSNQKLPTTSKISSPFRLLFSHIYRHTASNIEPRISELGFSFFFLLMLPFLYFNFVLHVPVCDCPIFICLYFVISNGLAFYWENEECKFVRCEEKKEKSDKRLNFDCFAMFSDFPCHLAEEQQQQKIAGIARSMQIHRKIDAISSRK